MNNKKRRFRRWWSAALLALVILGLSIRFEIRNNLRPYDMPDGAPVLISPEHTAYISAGSDGLFRPDEALSRGEACRILYSLLQDPIKGHCDFSDVPEDSSLYPAVACLSSWGMVSNSRGAFLPEQPLTRAQLLTMLSPLYPPLEGDTPYTDIAGHWAEADIRSAYTRGWLDDDSLFRPDEAVTRAEFCRVLNRVLGRSCDEAALLLSDDPALYADVPADHPLFGDVMEASRTHSHRTDSQGEHWILPTRSEGLYAVYGRLYYVREDGSLLRDGWHGSLYFGADGRYTSGDETLDRLMERFLLNCTDESMTREEKLRAAYLSIKYDYGYTPLYDGLDEVDCGDRDFEVPWARSYLEKGAGNCVASAAAFTMAARQLGYEALAVFGLFNTYRDDHCWTIIPEDGVNYIYDPEQEKARDSWMDDFDLYRVTDGDPLPYHYKEFYPDL